MKKNVFVSVSFPACIAAAAFVFIVDQMTKALVVKYFPWHTTRPVFFSLLYITPTQNRGSAFGLFQGGAHFFAMLSVAALCVMVFFIRRIHNSFLSHLGFFMVLGGALGNLADRVRFHYVVDFLDLKFWPVFNGADAAIVFGMACIAVDVIRKKGSFDL